MKIVEVSVIPLGYPIDDVPARMRSFALLRIATDEGIVGWGEASDSYGHSVPRTVAALVEETFRWLLVGQDPSAGDALVQRIRNRVYSTLGHRGLAMQVISAIDIALWDIRGKMLGSPVSAIIGRHRDEVDLYAAGRPEFRLTGQEYCDEVFAPLLKQGVRTVKVRPGRDVSWDRLFLEQIREALPAGTDIIADGYCNYRLSEALVLGQVLDAIGAMGFEEPIAPSRLSAVAQLASQLSVSLAYGEHCSTLDDFRDLLLARAIGIAEPDATICGGISEMVRIGALCRSFGVDVMPHCGGLTAVGLAANLHAAASIAGCGSVEFDARDVQPLRDELAWDEPFGVQRISDGRMRVPDGPGLGVELNEEVFERYPYEIDASISSSFGVYGALRG